jgi:PKD repeat protein
MERTHLIKWSIRGTVATGLTGRPILRWTRYLSAGVALSLLAACDSSTGGTAPEAPAQPPAASPGIVVLPLEVVLDEGVTSQLRVFERMPDGGAGRELSGGVEFTWQSGNASVASVERGLLRAAEVGATRVTVSTRDGRSASADVRVVREAARLEILSGQDQSGEVMSVLGNAVQVRVVSTLGRAVQGAVIGFAVVSGGGNASYSDVLTDADGVARTQWTLGPIAGEQVLEVRGPKPGLTSRVAALARPGPAQYVSVQPQYISVWQGAAMQLELVAMDAHGNRIQDVPVVWEVADPTVATVTPTGFLTGLELGETEVFGSLDLSAPSSSAQTPGLALAPGGNGKGKGTVVVGGPETFSISSAGDGQTGEVGATLADLLRLKVVDSQGRSVSQLQVDWVVTSGDGSVSSAQTSTNGNGQTQVTWTLGGIVGTQSVEARITGRDPIEFTATALVGPLATIEVSPVIGVVKTGETLQYLAKGTDRFGNTKPVTFFWSVEDGTTATVSSTGLVKGVKVSKTQVKATNGAISGAAELDVTDSNGSSNAAPVGAMTASCTGLTCDFADTSTDADGQIASRAWTFGDGGTSTEASLSRSYAVAGTYQVTLKVTDDKGATATTSKSVTVTAPAQTNQPPVAAMSFECAELTCSFLDTSTDADGQIASRSWTFGDGKSSTAATTSNTYAAGGTYTVTLNVTDDRGASSAVSRSVTVTAQVRTGYYVSTAGSPSGTGASDRPWDLQTALKHPTAVRPGDTIWVRGGTYRGTFQSYLDGTASAPIIVRAYPGERATIDTDAAFNIEGSASYTWFWGLEFMSSDPNRISSQTGSQPTDITRRASGITIRASTGIRIINCIVHDFGNGIGWWVQAVDSEIYGTVIYNNGWQAPDRGHGHGIYSQNQNGLKVLEDTYSFSNFGMNAQMYGSEAAYAWNYRLTRNAFFRPGELSSTGGTYNLIVGLSNPPVGRFGADNLVLEHNAVRGAQLGHMSVNIGYGSTNGTLTLGPGNLWYTGVELRGWQTVIGSVDPAPPTLQVTVRPNRHEPGRANVTIANPGLLSHAAVDLSGVLNVGDNFEVLDAQNYYGSPVVSGTYSGGTVNFPTNLTAVAQPIGNAPKAAVHTGADFNVYVVRRR